MTALLLSVLALAVGLLAAALATSEPARFRLRNLPHRLRGAKAELCNVFGLGNLSCLSAVIIRVDGSRVPLGIVSRRVITTAGVNYLASCFNNTAEPEAFNFHAMGTGNVAEAVGDTALGTQVETRSTGTQSVATNTYQTLATITATAPRVVTEHGVFSASTGGTLLDRSVFASNNLATGDAIQFTYVLTLTAGG